MSDPRAVLDEIRDRVHRMVTPDGKNSAPDRYLTDADRQAGNWDCIANIAGDLTRLAAAVRAVLDFTVGDKTPIWVGIALDEIIADAMGGTDA